MANNTVGDVDGDVNLNNAEGDITTAGKDAVGRDKIVNITEVHNHFTDDKTSKKASTVHIPRLMPYLANRLDQELQLGKKIKNHFDLKQPLICIIHGEENQCSDMFMERIVHESLFKIIPEQTQKGLKRYDFSCDTFKNSQELHEKMHASLAGNISCDMFAKPETVALILAQQKSPVLLCVTLSSDYCLAHKGTQAIDFFLEFWKNWSYAEQQNHLLLVCLCFDYKPVKRGFLDRLQRKNKLNKKIRDYLQVLDFSKFELHGVVLSELNHIEQHQVEDWARLHLTHIYEKLRPKIKQLFEHNKQQAIAMQPLALQLEKMLKELS